MGTYVFCIVLFVVHCYQAFHISFADSEWAKLQHVD